MNDSPDGGDRALPSPAASHIPPERSLVDSKAGLARTVDRLLALPARSLRIASPDGSLFDLASRRLVDAMERLLLADRLAQIRILVDDPAWIEAKAARLKLLQRRFPHALLLRTACVDDPVGEEGQMLADDLHRLVVKPGRLIAAELWLNNRPQAQAVLAEFDRRWTCAAHNMAVHPLGL
jgi:hypothetical protein